MLDPENRSILDDAELAWLDEQMVGDVDHLLVGTSLPFLLSPGLHHAEAFSEALAQGGWGGAGPKVGEKLRQELDLEHWAAFQDGFQKVAAMTLEVARGQRGRAPGTVTFLSGDVHHSYVSEGRPTPDELADGGPIHSRILQAVCSPIRNPMPRRLRFLVAVLAYGVAGPIGHVVARSAKVPDAPADLEGAEGPVVRQQPGHPRGRRPRAADVVGHRQGRGRAARPAAPEGRRRPDGRLTRDYPPDPCPSSSPPPPLPGSPPSAAPGSNRS